MTNETYKGKKVIWESKTRQIFSVIICFIFTITTLWLFNYDKIEFWFSLLLFGVGGIFMLFRLLNPNNIFATYKSKIGKEILSEREQMFQNDTGIFEYNKTQFKITIEQTSNEYSWNDIETIFAYKIDLLAYDEICLDVLTNDNEKFTITESTPGWFQFISRLSDYIDSIKLHWFMEVANPAFDTNLTLIYDKQNRSQEEIRNQMEEEKHYS